jgi:Transglutaminase-like superfamily
MRKGLRTILFAVIACGALARTDAGAGEKRKIAIPFEKLPWKRYLGTSVWYGIYTKDKKCGYMHNTITMAKRGKQDVVRFNTRVHIKVSAMGTTVTIDMTDLRDYSPKDGKLVFIQNVMNSPLATMRSSARPVGKELKCTTVVSGQTREKAVPLPKENLGGQLSLQVIAVRKDVRVGDTLESEGFEPNFAAVNRTVYTVKSIRKTTFRGVTVEIVEILAQNFTVTKDPPPAEPAKRLPDSQQLIKVDRSGRPLEGTIMGSFTFRLESAATAKNLAQVSDIMLTTAVSLGKRILRARSSRKVVLAVTSMPETAIINTSRQKFVKEKLRHRLILTTDKPPAKAGPVSLDEKKKLAAYLKATSFLQCDDPRIKKQAAETVGAEKDPYKAAGLLSNWVFRNVKKQFTPVISNALDTLKTRSGDCGEHAALFVALCRAAGIPAREVGGLAYSDAGGGILGGHAWAEIYAGGKWYTMDPTFGQKNADPLHIKIAEGGMGGMGGMVRLADLMGKIKVKVLSVE